jgi:hypothetical protein
MSTYAAQLIRDAQQAGFNVTDLYADADTLQNFERAIVDADIFMGYGHGNKSLFTGNCKSGAYTKNSDGTYSCKDFEVLLQSTANASDLNAKKCYLAACQTAVTLGPALIHAGCPEFYGYLADFTFVYDPDKASSGDVLNDTYAAPFFDAALTTAYSILSGKAPSAVFEDTVNRYEALYDQWKTVNDPLADDVMTWLNWDRQNFAVLTPKGAYETPRTSLLTTAGIIVPLGAAALLLLLLSRQP